MSCHYWDKELLDKKSLFLQKDFFIYYLSENKRLNFFSSKKVFCLKKTFLFHLFFVWKITPFQYILKCLFFFCLLPVYLVDIHLNKFLL